MGPKSNIPIQHAHLKYENPEAYYDFGEEIGRGKFAVCKKVKNKESGETFAAKIIKFDSDTLRFAVRELDWMTQDNDNGKLDHVGLVKFVEAYLVRKYLIIVQEFAGDKTILDYVVKRHSYNEDIVAGYIKQLCKVLEYLHKRNCLHLDIRPTNIRIAPDGNLKLIDYNSARTILNKKAGEVVDVIGDTEFCAPEMLCFDPVMAGSDMWSVAVLTYILLSGISPFFYEDEDKVLSSVQACKWAFDPEAFGAISSNAKEFIQNILSKRAPESRMTATEALNHPWLAEDYESVRKGSALDCIGMIEETDGRLYEEEEEDYVWASLVFKTFEESEFESPESSEEE